jgi:hypothetical protein
MKRLWQDPAYRARHYASTWARADYRQRQLEAVKARWADPEFARVTGEKISAGHRRFREAGKRRQRRQAEAAE